MSKPCPICGRVVGTYSTGRLRSHYDPRKDFTNDPTCEGFLREHRAWLHGEWRIVPQSVWIFQIGDVKEEWIVQRVTPNIIYYTVIGESEDPFEYTEWTREEWMDFVAEGELKSTKRVNR
jgi:hypothetical protein